MPQDLDIDHCLDWLASQDTAVAQRTAAYLRAFRIDPDLASRVNAALRTLADDLPGLELWPPDLEAERVELCAWLVKAAEAPHKIDRREVSRRLLDAERTLNFLGGLATVKQRR